MKKITDLEKFAVEDIFRPYQNMVSFGDKPLSKLPMGLDEIWFFGRTHPEWWQRVIGRLAKLDIYFPSYINHGIVYLVQHDIKEYKKFQGRR